MENIHHLGLIKGLERLTLKDNGLNEIGLLPADSFGKLNWLSVEQNNFTHCRVITQLLQFPSLEKLYIRLNPIGEKRGHNYVRDRCTGELPLIKTINGSDLKKYERRDCEIFYLRKTFEDFFNASGCPHYDYKMEDFL